MPRAALIRVAALAVLLAAVPGVSGHGWVLDGRSWTCGEKAKTNWRGTKCEPVFNNKFPHNLSTRRSQMVLTHNPTPGGRLRQRPLPKHVCGFGSETWGGGQTPWDQALDWPTKPMKSGYQYIRWINRGANWGSSHGSDTFEFVYWITKPGFKFSPNRELQWSDLEDKPFCHRMRQNSADWNKHVKHKNDYHWDTGCDVPPRNGHHIIYCEWGRKGGATPAVKNQRFHSCIDGMFSGGGGGGAPAPKPQPQPSPQTCQKVQGYTLCKGNDYDKCCPNGTKCYAYSNSVSVCLQTCPAGWECAKGSQCQVHGGYHLCQGKQWCCPKNTKCYAYNNQVSACMAACPQGWRC